MVEFQITKRRNSTIGIFPKPAQGSFRNTKKIIIEPNFFNGEVVQPQMIPQKKSDQGESFEQQSKINVNPFSRTTVGFRFNQRQQSGQFRKTSLSFHKKSFKNNENPNFEDEIFRKTTLSIQNMQKKSSFFDNLTDNQETLQRFKIIGQIGKGSFSIVSSAFDKQSRQHCAVKIYEKINSLSWHYLQNIKRQINSLKSLDHENVVRLLSVIKDKNKLMIFIQNGGRQTMAGLLRKNKILSQKQVKSYFNQIVQAVKHCHLKGVCHRDLKPENVLINEAGNAKLIDFGFSAFGKTYLTSYCGTPPFMCPQIVQKRPYIGMKADIWALGVILFLMLNGKLPFKATTEQELYRLIQTGKYTFQQTCTNQYAKRLIGKMLKVHPQQRITIEQVANDKWLRS